MLDLLVALILFALAVCAAVAIPPSLVVTASTVVAIAPGPSARTDCAVAARSAGDTARSGRGEDEGCAGGGSAPAAGLAAIVPDLRVAGNVGPAGVDSLTVTRKP